MKRLVVALFATCVCACATSHAPAASHGAISVQVMPNPVVAHPLGNELYEFPFDVVVHETAGRAVTITRVSAEVYAMGGFPVANDTYDSARLASHGFATKVPGNSELRYHFAPRKRITNDSLFGNVSAQVRVDAIDDTDAPLTASVTVTITK